MKDRNRDFEFIYFLKDDDSYVFTSQRNHNRMLRRESLTRSVNNTMKIVSEKLLNKPILTSNSFRTGYITQLWKDTNDIEFVRQVVGHVKIESTSSYIENLTEEERKLSLIKLK